MNLQIEITNHCQLKCHECPNRLMKRPRSHMSEEVFDVVLNKYIVDLKDERERLGYPPTIILHKDGEPLLNPRLKDYIARIAKEKPDFRLNLYTNGLLLTRDFIDFLDSIPNKIWLFTSFHFYEYLGKKVDYSRVDDLFKSILNSSRPYDNIEFVFTSHVTQFMPVDDLNVWARIWESQVPQGRVTICVNNHINPWTGLIEAPNCVTFDACPYADFGHLFIGSTGNVIPCCMDLNEVLVFGNIMKDDPPVIYGRLNHFYELLREKKDLPELCIKCMGGLKK